jgi:hypothetical protein
MNIVPMGWVLTGNKSRKIPEYRAAAPQKKREIEQSRYYLCGHSKKGE